MSIALYFIIQMVLLEVGEGRGCCYNKIKSGGRSCSDPLPYSKSPGARMAASFVVVRAAARRSCHSPLAASPAQLFHRYSFSSNPHLRFHFHKLGTSVQNASRAVCSRQGRLGGSLLPSTASPALRAEVTLGRTYYSTKPTLRERTKVIVKEYGPIGFAFYITVSLMSLGTCYLLVDK